VVTVRNDGQEPATGIELALTVGGPQSVGAVSGGGTATVAGSESSVTWEPFDLAAGTQAVFTVARTVGADAEVDAELSATASAADDATHGQDLTPANNTAADATTVGAVALVDVTVRAARKIYGAADPVFTLSGVPTGWVAGQDYEVQFGRDPGERVGEYEVTAEVTAMPPGYAVGTVTSGTLTVDERPVTVTVGSGEREFTGELISVSLPVTVTGGTLADGDALATATATAAGTAVGEYPSALATGAVRITREGTDVSANYAITVGQGTLSIIAGPDSPDPSGSPSPDPSESPTPGPSGSPSPDPSGTPSSDPGESPSPDPSDSPSSDPSESPASSLSPSTSPGAAPPPGPDRSPSPGSDAVPSPGPLRPAPAEPGAPTSPPASASSGPDASTLVEAVPAPKGPRLARFGTRFKVVVIPAGTATKLKVATYPAPETPTGSVRVTWKSRAAAIATVTKGKKSGTMTWRTGSAATLRVTALAVGRTQITLSSPGAKPVTIEIKVIPRATATSKRLVTMRLSGPSALTVGGSVVLKPDLNPAGAVRAVGHWRSTNRAVATVNAVGRVTARAKGKTVIVLVVNGRTAKKTITVG
jgi:hypothetical protein